MVAIARNLALCLILTCPNSSFARADDAVPARPSTPKLDRQGDPLPAGASVRLGTTRFRPVADVRKLLYTHDGKLLISVDDDGLDVWDAETGKLLRQFSGHNLPESAPVALAPNGNHVAIGGLGRAGVYDLRSGIRLWLMKADHKLCTAICYSPDGARVAAYVENHEVQLYDARTGMHLHSWNQPEIPVVERSEFQGGGISFSRDGAMLQTETLHNRGLYFWDVITSTVVRQFDRPSYELGGMAKSADGKHIATVALRRGGHFFGGGVVVSFHQQSPPSCHIGLWNVATGKLIRTFEVPCERSSDRRSPSVWNAAFSPDGSTLATVASDGVVHLWQVPSAKLLRKFSVESMHPNVVAFQPDGKAIALGEGKHALQIIDLATGKSRFTDQDHQESIRTVSCKSDGREISTICDDESVRLWDAGSGREIQRMSVQGHRSHQFLAGNRVFYEIDCEDGTFRCFERATGDVLFSELERFYRHSDEQIPVISHDEQFIGVRGEDDAIELLDSTTGKTIRVFRDPRAVPIRFEGLNLLNLTRWGVSKFAGKGTPVQRIAFTDGDTELLGFFHEGLVYKWSVSDGKQLSAARLNEINDWFNSRWFSHAEADLDVSSNGRLIARRDCVVDLATGQQLHGFHNRGGDSNPVRFSLDSRSIAVAGRMENNSPRRGYLRVFEIATGQERVGFEEIRGDLNALAFAPDNSYLVSGGSDSSALVWPLSIEPTTLRPTELVDCWAGLGSTDAAVAFRAIQRLSADPAGVIALFRKQLPPVGQLDPQRVEQLVVQLGHDSFAEREKASAELDFHGDVLTKELTKWLEQSPVPEIKSRLVGILSQHEPHAIGSRRLRDIRAAEVLERIGSTAARELLREYATGAPASRLTQEAREALVRLKLRPGPG